MAFSNQQMALAASTLPPTRIDELSVAPEQTHLIH